MFTHLAVPAMTRLRLPEREVLDALVDSGVAEAARMRSRGAYDWFSRTRANGSKS